ncbi:MAG: Na/Pi cotransporter family protein [Clostridia bacterium]|nr:Na/Pi cotransporter family protein [Clostridia bacterium]
MEYVYIILKILGGMGALLIGMKMLSENLTRLAHNKLQTLLNKTAKNRFACVGIGTAVTVIGQSSAFTTVMVVGLVNAGIMTLFQATAMIMGANVGTTLVTWIVSLTGLSGAEVDITMFFLAFAAVGALMLMISKKDKVKSIGSALAGFGIIFVGLMVMKNAFPQTGPEAEVIKNIFGAKIHPLLLLLIGIALTALLQSSTAVNAIIISMLTQGIMIGGVGGGNALYFIIIGTNIGTCVTALISSIGAKPNAKRAALIHFLFNFFGAIIFIVLLLAWKGFADTLLTPVFPNNPEMRIALFHTIFNVIGTMIFIPFINLFVKLANLIVRDKKKGEEEQSALALSELDERLLNSPSIALGYLYQETGNIFAYAMKTLDRSFNAFMKKETEAKEKVTEANAELSAANKKVVSYLIKLSASPLTMDEEKTVSSLHYVLNDIMRIGELADNVTKYTGHYVNDNLVFSQEFLSGLEEMYGKIKNLYAIAYDAYLNKDSAKLEEVDMQEDAIDKDRRKLVSTHIERLNEGKCQPQNSSVFINLVGNLERAADHITYIAHSFEQSGEHKEVTG